MGELSRCCSQPCRPEVLEARRSQPVRLAMLAFNRAVRVVRHLNVGLGFYSVRSPGGPLSVRISQQDLFSKATTCSLAQVSFRGQASLLAAALRLLYRDKPRTTTMGVVVLSMRLKEYELAVRELLQCAWERILSETSRVWEAIRTSE